MLTDLEYAALGVIWLEQPCTAYTVRMVFSSSLSSHWSGSTGSIYPLIGRLVRQRLISERRKKGDGRGAKLYRLTPRGRAQLVKWVGPPMPDGSELIAFDPLRARFRFLRVLRRSQAQRAIRDAHGRLGALLVRIREEKRSAQKLDATMALAHRGAELAVQAQRRWLEEIRAEIT